MRIFVLLLAALATSVIVACAEEAARPVPELSFAGGAPIMLKVRVAEIDSHYRPEIIPPNIERSVAPTPEAALIKWAQQRLRSDGSENIARFTILDAPLTAEPLPATGGILGAFSSQPAQRWTVILEAQLEFLDETGNRLDGFLTKVTRTRELPQGVSLEERKLFWHEMIAAAMSEFDTQMNAGTRRYAGRWLH